MLEGIKPSTQVDEVLKSNSFVFPCIIKITKIEYCCLCYACLPAVLCCVCGCVNLGDIIWSLFSDLNGREMWKMKFIYFIKIKMKMRKSFNFSKFLMLSICLCLSSYRIRENVRVGLASSIWKFSRKTDYELEISHLSLIV